MAADGTFTIPNVPTGTFWLRFQEATGPTAPVGPAIFLETASGTGIDLGYDQLGRANVTRTSTTTTVTFPVTLAKNWNSADQIQIASSNADVGEWLSRVNPNFRSNFALGNASAAPLNLIRTGDVVTLFHLYNFTDSSSGLTYRAARARADRTDTNIPGGAAITVPRYTLTAPTVNGTVPGGLWSTATFESYRTLMNVPTGTGTTHSLVIGASVGSLTGYGPQPRNSPPTLFTMSAPLGTTNRTVGANLQYVHVLAQNGTVTAQWNEWRGVEFGGSVTYTAAGATTGVTERASMGRRDALTALSALTPTLSPVRTLAVAPKGGLPVAAYTAVTGVGLEPTLTWDPPAVGTPTSYVVEVFRLARNGTATTSTKVADVLHRRDEGLVPARASSPREAHTSSR